MEGADAVTGPLLRLQDVTLRRGARVILDRVSIDVGHGEILAIMGASGSGKTTLLRVLAGLEVFDAGQIEVDGLVLPAGPPSAPVLRQLRTRVGMVFQFHCLFEHLSALENVCLAPVHVRGVPVADADARARDLLGQLGVGHRANALPRELSGGEAQRVAIARALATDPPVLLLDEPTASLDPDRRTELSLILRALAASGRTLVIVTHDDDFAGAAASRVLHLHEGRVDRSRPLSDNC